MSQFPKDQAARKQVRLHAGVDRYFPQALIGVAEVSAFGNRKHNAGEPELFDDRSKSNDDLECLRRHLWDFAMGDGYDDDSGSPAIYHAAWRVLRMAQKWAETKGAPIAPAARNARLPLAEGVTAQVIPHALAAAMERDGVVPRDDDEGAPGEQPREHA